MHLGRFDLEFDYRRCDISVLTIYVNAVRFILEPAITSKAKNATRKATGPGGRRRHKPTSGENAATNARRNKYVGWTDIEVYLATWL